jgi:hypothetical protein
MSETRPRKVAAAVAVGVLTLGNFLCLRHEDSLWSAFSGVEAGVPSMAAVRSWDAIQWAFGVIGLPIVVVALVRYLFAGRPLRGWSGTEVMAFLVCLAIVYSHLHWSFEWARETHIAVPNLLVRAVTFVSLNAAVLVSIIASMVVLSWYRHRRLRSEATA